MNGGTELTVEGTTSPGGSCDFEILYVWNTIMNSTVQQTPLKLYLWKDTFVWGGEAESTVYCSQLALLIDLGSIPDTPEVPLSPLYQK